MKAETAPLGARRGLLVRATVLAALLPLASCTVGPDFVPPTAPAAKHLAPGTATSDLAAGAGEPTQRLVEGQPISAQWWRMFHNSTLDRVERDALASSPTLAAARATLAQAREEVAAARGGYYPQVGLAASAERQKGPPFALGLLPSASQGLPIFNLYQLGPTVSFLPDAFGLTARTVEAQQALADDAGYQLAAARLTMTGSVATQALTIAALRRQIDAAREIVAEDRKNLALVRQARDAGRATRGDELSAQAQLAEDRAALPPLRAQRSAAEDALAVLVGRAPTAWSVPRFDLDDFTLPTEIPVSLPSTLVRQRPDILAAQARLHARSAAIGIATAQMYPSFPISASIGTAALATTTLGASRSIFWTLAGGLVVPIFQGGTLQAQRRAAVDAFHASLAVYRQTVLAAFGQVADTLHALRDDAALADAERRALDAATAAASLQRVRYAAGRGTVPALIEAERAVQRARIGYAGAQSQRDLDTARLLVAMGGGWRQDATPDSSECSQCVRERRHGPAQLAGANRSATR